MLRLRLLGQVPPNGLNIGYAESGQLNSQENVSLVDMSYLRVENLSSYVGGQLDIDLMASPVVDTDEAVLSPRSVLSRNVRRVAPLFYKYRIGRGVYSVIANPTSPSDLLEAKHEILKEIQILDRFNNKIPGPDWDIEVAGQNANGKYLVDLFLGRRQLRNETFKVRYQASRTADNERFPNHIEVINATPILVEGTDYTLTIGSDGYQISGLATANHSPFIGIFYDGALANGVVVIDNPAGFMPTRVRLRKDDLSYEDVYFAGLTVEELVEEINERGVVYTAVALSDNSQVRPQGGTWSVTKYGRAFLQNNFVHVKYNEETKVRPLLPYRGNALSPWYPRVDRGKFSQVVPTTGLDYHRYFFEPKGDTIIKHHGRLGASTYDVLDENPVMLDVQVVSLRKPNIMPETIILRYIGKDVSSYIKDYDELNSVLFLNTRISDPRGLTASYSHREDALVYLGIDLNPTGFNNPQVLGKYVGVYMTPSAIVGTDGTNESFDRTLWHVIADDMPTILSRVSEVTWTPAAGTPIPVNAKALLLGVYQVTQPSTVEDVKVTDTRTRGGGLKDDYSPEDFKDAPEADMFADFGLWNGEPFPPTAVVVEFPSAVIGTGIPPMDRDPGADPSGFFTPSGLLSIEDVQIKANRYKAGGVIAIVMPEDDLNV